MLAGMPARMLRTLPQEATEFEQRMGCMAGVFQIFDRRHGLLTARRRGGGGREARSTVTPGPGTHCAGRFSFFVCFSSTPNDGYMVLLNLNKLFVRLRSKQRILNSVIRQQMLK